MSQKPTDQGTAMPGIVDTFLTNKILCALLAVMMLTAVYWLDMLFGNLGLIAFLFLLVGVLLHLGVPGLIALVSLGGGPQYSLQVGGIAALMLLALSSGSVSTVLVFLMLFVLLPTVTAQVMRWQGLGQASLLLAALLFIGFATAMVMAASPQDLEAFVHQQFKPTFDAMIARIPPEAKEDIANMHTLQGMMVKVFPGFFIFGLWLIWWGDLILARWIAQKYGFYQGVDSPVLSFALPRVLVYVLLVLLGLANMATGNLQYLALNGVIVLSALIAVQGIAVSHAWLASKGMGNGVLVMYAMLFFWSFVVVIFTLIGLFDMWFNFRRKFVSATGEK